MAGQGSTALAHAYAFDDYLAPLGPLYYRLRQVDTVGQATFSPVVAVTAGTSAALFPNPTHQFLHIAAPSATRYRVRNQLGQLLRKVPLPMAVPPSSFRPCPSAFTRLSSIPMPGQKPSGLCGSSGRLLPVFGKSPEQFGLTSGEAVVQKANVLLNASCWLVC